MAYQSVLGPGPLYPEIPSFLTLPPAFLSSTIDATGEKVAISGPVWFQGRSGTKDIRRVGFRFGTVTKSGGSGLTVSLQNVNTAAGPPLQPDETQDQTVAISNADASFASNTWIRTGTLSADRTVSFGEMLSVVIEYDGSGRLSSDSVQISGLSSDFPMQTCIQALKTSSWATSTIIPNVVLEFSDGTFGTLLGALPVSGLTATTVNSGTASADEYALEIQAPYPMRIDGLWAMQGTANDCELILYSGTSAERTVSIDGNTIQSASARTHRRPIATYDIAANTAVRVAIKPTTTSNITVYRFSVNDANHWSCWPGGTTCAMTTRVDSGSWAAATATERILAGVQIAAFDDAVGGGGSTIVGAGPLIGGRLVR